MNYDHSRSELCRLENVALIKLSRGEREFSGAELETVIKIKTVLEKASVSYTFNIRSFHNHK